MPLWKTTLFFFLAIALEVSAGKWKKELDFNSPKISQLIRQGFTLSCADCSSLQYYLPGAEEPTVIPCPEEKVCGPIDGGFNCIAADSPDASECSCGGEENAFIPDPYDKIQYYACLPGGDQVATTCAVGTFFTGDLPDPCADVPECTSIGFSKDTCTRSYFCDAVGATPTISTCETGTVWDDINFGCVDPCSLAPEAFTCDSKEDGAHPDTTDCAIFHLCFFGTHIEQQCTGDKPYFHTTDNSCKAEDPGTCVKTTDLCYEDYKDACSDTTTTSAISTTGSDTTDSIITSQSSETSITTEKSTTNNIDSTVTTEKTTTETSESTKDSSDSSIITDTTVTTISDSTIFSPEPFTCDGKEEGAHPDPIDCSKFHLCFLGTHIEQQCTGDKPYFHPTDNSCKAEDPGTCVKTTTTKTVSTTVTPQSSATPTTTETTATASSEPTTDSTEPSTTTEKITTDSPDCSKVTSQEYFTKEETCKEFYSCESDQNGGFTLKEYSCPGPLVFDPVNQYCNLLNLVPSCGDGSSTVPPSLIDPTTDSSTDSSPDSSTDSTSDSTTYDTSSPIIDCDQVTSQTYYTSEETCNKFYSCESDDNGGFALKEYSCPGELVFDPINQYCNLLNLVPSCQ